MTGILKGIISGPAVAVDETILRFSGTSGVLAQASSVTVSDTDVVGGITQLNVDNLRADGNTISSTDTDGAVVVDPDGSGEITLGAAVITVEDDIVHAGDTNNLISFDTDSQSFETGGTSRLDISDTGIRLGAANSRVTTILDEDAMGTDSATALCTQQSIKYYADNLTAQLSAGYFFANSLDDITSAVTSDGANISLAVEKTGGGNPDILFSTGVHEYTASNVTLTAGADDENPVLNYVYILESNKTLTGSTVGWPATEHLAIAEVLCQTAASLQTYGPYKNHQWKDDIQESDSSGHSTSINFWVRQQNATWQSGIAATPTVGAATFTLATSAGTVLQMHNHTFPVFDTGVASAVYVPNDNTTKYDRVTDLKTLLTDSGGGGMSGRSFNLVVWGCVCETESHCKLYINLPTSSYAVAASAVSDADKTSVFTIPAAFKGTAFLISRLTLSHNAGGGGTWTLNQNEDLRGLVPATATGSGVGGISAVVDDPTPVLGGNLDGGGFNITNTAQIQCDNLELNTNTLSSTDTDGNINLTPDGAGLNVLANAQITNCTASRAIVTDASSNLNESTTTATEIGYVNGVTSAIQTQIDTKVTGPGSATDHAIVRYDLATGKLVQDSSVIISDTNQISGITELDIDNVNINGNSIISSDTDGNLNYTPNGTGLNILANAQITNCTASRAIVTDASSNLNESTTTATEIGYVNGVTSAIQTQIDTKVTGPGSSTDHAIMRFDLATGKLAQDSSVLIDDTNNVTGVVNLTIADDIIHTGDTNNLISFGTDTQSFETGGTSRLDLSDTGIRLGAANSRVTTILDEDDMATDSATALATQQSIKAYIDTVKSSGSARDITQNGHGFTGGEVLYLNGAVYTLAKADAVATSEVIGFIISVIDVNIFTLQFGGHISAELAGLTAGAPQYLSTTVAGALQEAKPAGAGTVIKPVMVADSATSAYWKDLLGVLL